MERPYRDRDWLDERYHGGGLTQREIGELCGVSATTVRKYMRKFGIETREVAGENHGLYGTERSAETRQKISETLRGREFSEETRRRIGDSQRGQSLPEHTREKISDALRGRGKSAETRMKMSRSTAGDRNPNWKGGKYTEEWYGPGWAVIRERIRERDRVCQNCGEDGSNLRLEVHHITPLRFFRESENHSLEDGNEHSNLVLLCKRCHGLAEHGSIQVGSSVDGVDATGVDDGVDG